MSQADAAHGIVILNLVTHRVERLPGSEGLVLAEWSPDGRYIAARSSDHHVIMLFDVRMQHWSELARGELNWLNWSRGGRHVYFEQHGAQHAVLRVGVDDHKVDEVVSLQNVKRTGVNGSFWFGLAPDDSPLVLHDTGAGDLRARLERAVDLPRHNNAIRKMGLTSNFRALNLLNTMKNARRKFVVCPHFPAYLHPSMSS